MATEDNETRPEEAQDSVMNVEDKNVSKSVPSVDPEKGKTERLSVNPRALKRYLASSSFAILSSPIFKTRKPFY